jgi:hypothetical protein
MTVWLYVVGIESKVVEVWELDKDVSQRLHGWVISFTSSSDLTSSGCLFAMCFSTKDVALNSFWQVLQRNLPSSSCFMYGSATFDNSLDRL